MTEKQKNKRVIRPVRVVLLAAALAAALGVSALAANPAVREQIRYFFMSFSYTVDGTAPGSFFMTVEGAPEDGTLLQAANALPEMAYEVRDGRNIFTIGGEERDVTDAMAAGGCYETAGEGYTLKLMPDGTALVEMADGEGNSISWKLLLDGTGVVPNADRFQFGTGEQWTVEDGEVQTAQRGEEFLIGGED